MCVLPLLRYLTSATSAATFHLSATGTDSATTAIAPRIGASHGPHGQPGSAPCATCLRDLLKLRGGLSPSSSSSPQAMVQAWRAERLGRFSTSFDASRYHAQVLFVDDDGARARTCEALLERVATWSDAGWWIYPHSATTTGSGVPDGSAPLPSLSRTARDLGLCPARLGARAATLEAADLLAYDLIVAVDFTVLEQVQGLVHDAAVVARREAGEAAAVEAAARCELLAAIADSAATADGCALPGRGRRTDVGRGSRLRTFKRTRRAQRLQRLEAAISAARQQCIDHRLLAAAAAELARARVGGGDAEATTATGWPGSDGAAGDIGAGREVGQIGEIDELIEEISSRVLCLSDFLAFSSSQRDSQQLAALGHSEDDRYGDRMECLDEDLRSLVARHYAAAATLTELPSAAPSDAAAWEPVLAAATLCCAGLTCCLKELIDVWFVDAFNGLLNTYYPSAQRLDSVTWAEADAVLRRYQVTGALDPLVRERLFTEHCDEVRGRVAAAPGAPEGS